MLALVKYGFGKGETELREVPEPVCGDDDLIIEVKAAGICGSDIAYDNGDHPTHLRPPVILGHEFSGVVAQKGKNVVDWNIGDRIVSDNTGYVCGKCYACTTGDYLMCPERLGLGYSMDGGFTKYVKIRGDVLARNPNCVFPIPDNVSFEEAAIMDPVCNGYKALVQESKFMPGDDVIVFGVGPIGLYAIQVAKVAGAGRIVAVGLSSDAKRFETAKLVGATDVVASDVEDLAGRLKEIGGENNFRIAIDCAGVNSVIVQAIDVLSKGGQIVKIGYDKRPYNNSLDPIIDKGISIIGHFGYNYVTWKNCMNLLKLGKLNMKVMISHTMTLPHWREGFELARKKESIKIILKYAEK